VVNSPKVVVAAVQGPAVGVGVALVLAADLTIMRSDAYLLLAFTKIGLMPDGGATALLAASAGRATAQRLALLAEPITAHEAAGAGLIAALHGEDEFDEQVEAALVALAAGPGPALARTKQVINDACLVSLDTSLAAERAGQLELLASADFAEGVAAFEQRRKPVFDTPA
jgi:enoyl-CoA hydratase